MKGKKIIVGVSGSIATYKSALLVRELIKQGAEVRVIMTQSACEFITPLTLSTLSNHKVYTDFKESNTAVWNSHVELGLWADCLLIAPASANTLGKLANGLCDNILSATYLSARCPVVLCPAMDLDMYQHPSVLANIDKLKSYGNHFIDATYGELASGLVGKGRMAEPQDIVKELALFLNNNKPLLNKKILITSGPTREPLDPVRFISNHSSGKMGQSIADEATLLGAEVTFVTGPTTNLPIYKNAKTIQINTADEMFDAVSEHFDSSDIIIFAAAVADYTPIDVSSIKIKKKEDSFSLALTKTKDIAYEMGLRKAEGQIMVGFALETNDEFDNAKRKLKSKNLDLIVLNSLNDKGSGFGHDTNKITILDKKDTFQLYELKSKQMVARDILEAIIATMAKTSNW